MTIELLFSLMAYVFSTSITPGPNNLIVLSSGANYGFARTVPVMSGIMVGFVIMVIIIGLCLMQIFDEYPLLQDILKILGIGYCIYLAWNIIRTKSMGDVADTSAPLSFIQGALFQWLNPKAWIMAITSVTLYAPDNSILQIGIVAGIIVLWGVPAIMLWTTMGTKIRRLLGTPRRLQSFNWIMGGLLIASVLPVLWL